MTERILVVEDNENLRYDLQKIVMFDAPHRCVTAVKNEVDAEPLIAETSFDVVITDIKLDEAGGTETGGLRVLKAVQEKDHTTPVIVVTAYGKMEIPARESVDAEKTSVEAMVEQMGAFAYVPRPHPERNYLDVIREQVTLALKLRRSLHTETGEK